MWAVDGSIAPDTNHASTCFVRTLPLTLMRPGFIVRHAMTLHSSFFSIGLPSIYTYRNKNVSSNCGFTLCPALKLSPLQTQDDSKRPGHGINHRQTSFSLGQRSAPWKSSMILRSTRKTVRSGWGPRCSRESRQLSCVPHSVSAHKVPRNRPHER
jgi:hypothetical protein